VAYLPQHNVGMAPIVYGFTAGSDGQECGAPLQAAVYLDGRYIGRPEDFRDGRIALSVAPGTHTVELQYGAATHTHTVQVQAGARVVLNDRL